MTVIIAISLKILITIIIRYFEVWLGYDTINYTNDLKRKVCMDIPFYMALRKR